MISNVAYAFVNSYDFLREYLQITEKRSNGTPPCALTIAIVGRFYRIPNVLNVKTQVPVIVGVM